MSFLKVFHKKAKVATSPQLIYFFFIHLHSQKLFILDTTALAGFCGKLIV